LSYINKDDSQHMVIDLNTLKAKKYSLGKEYGYLY
jgi:hypothetical protein